jgi:hypothetical protein
MVSVNPKLFSFVSWNLRGLGDDDKCVVARDALSLVNATVICIQETKLAVLENAKAHRFLPHSLSEFTTVDADGSRGGIVTAWDGRLLENTGTRREIFSLTTSFISTTSDLSFTITNVYAPSDHSLTSEFIREMLVLSSAIDGPWLVLSDFNLIRYPEEKNNDNFDRSVAEAFNSLIRDAGWFELDLRDRRFT